LDEVTYTVSSDGTTRDERFDADPHWTAQHNDVDGHHFGYDSLATTLPGGVSLAELLTLPSSKRTAAQTARLRQHYYHEHAKSLVDLQQQIASFEQERAKVREAAPLALVWREMESPRPTHVLIRGDFLRPGKLVERDVPTVFPPLSVDAARDRLAFARWLVDGRHPLTARVAVNRYWKQVFGSGLVRTPDDFGVRGELPTHPELLDNLAVRFQADGWGVKQLLRMMVTSATYRQSSHVTQQMHAHDPDNRLLARGNRFRLTAEEIRDMSLTASGLLNRAIGGRSTYPYQPDHFYRDKEDDANEWKWPLEAGGELYRRGLYTFIRRTSPYPSFQTFDVSGRGECTVARARTNTPLQALVTSNDPVFVEAARVLAERVLTEVRSGDDERFEFLFICVLSRRPSDAESAVVMDLYRDQLERYRADPSAAQRVRSQGKSPVTPNLDAAEVAAWTTVANAILNVDEAITRE
jgi:hypothetical protein